MSTAAVLYEAARKAVPLPDLWASYGWPTKVMGSRVVSTTSPCCGESRRDDALSMQVDTGNIWRWKCFRCNSGGSAIDAVALKEGVTSFQAARRLVNAYGGIERITGIPVATAVRRPKYGTPEQQKAVAKAVGALRESRALDPKVKAYLAGRGISTNTIAAAVDKGILRSLPASPATARTWWDLTLTNDEQLTAGVIKQGARLPASCYRPLVFMAQDDGAEFRTIGQATGAKALQLGLPKRPIVWVPDKEPTAIAVVEGGIDLLSAIDLGMTNTLIIGLFGTAAWRPDWIAEFREAVAPGCRWYIATDADVSGDSAASTIIKQLDDAGVAAERKRPWGGKDWNDVLVAARTAFG